MVGGSFGGYLSLAAATRDSALLKCVVSVAGVSDLRELKNDSNFFGISLVVKDMIGSDPEKLKADSPRLHADTFRAGAADPRPRGLHRRARPVGVHGKAMDAANKPYKMLMMEDTDHYFAKHAAPVVHRHHGSCARCCRGDQAAASRRLTISPHADVPPRPRGRRPVRTLPVGTRSTFVFRPPEAGILSARSPTFQRRGRGYCAQQVRAAWEGRWGCLVAAAQQDVKEWSHEILENARLRRAAHGSSVRDSGPDPPEPTDEEINEEIIVTAQKRATTLQDVPFSVAALTNEDIEQSGATNIVELARNVPASTSPISGPARARSRSAASAPARWFATSGCEGIRRHLPG